MNSSFSLAGTENDMSTGRVKTRILLIDDDAAYVFLCKRYLRSDDTFKHTVVSAGTMHEALKICESDTFDCIVIDYRLPDETGTEVIKQLRELLGHAMPPTIVFTADGGEEAAIEAVRSGANGVPVSRRQECDRKRHAQKITDATSAGARRCQPVVAQAQ